MQSLMRATWSDSPLCVKSRKSGYLDCLGEPAAGGPWPPPVREAFSSQVHARIACMGGKRGECVCEIRRSGLAGRGVVGCKFDKQQGCSFQGLAWTQPREAKGVHLSDPHCPTVVVSKVRVFVG